MDKAMVLVGGMRNAYRIPVEKSSVGDKLGRSRNRWQNNRMDL
jgi:hypothetical protein